MNEALKLLQQARLDLRNLGNDLKDHIMCMPIEIKKIKEKSSLISENFKKILNLLQQKPDKISLTLAKKENGNLKFSQS